MDRVPTLLVVGTLDTKGEELRFFADQVHRCDVQVLLLNAGVFDTAVASDIAADEVAEAAGTTLQALVDGHDRATAVNAMGRGAGVIAARLFREGAIDGVAGLGGSGGAAITAAAIRDLPIGVPKLMVSTTVSGDTRPYVGGKDVTMMYPVVDVAGLNRLSRQILSNAAAAIAAMARRCHAATSTSTATGNDDKLVGATMWGNTTPCVTAVRERLEAAGLEVLTFHATGDGGRSMEQLMRDGYVGSVVDITTTEIVAEIAGSPWTAGPDRLEVAGELGLPQVVAPGCIDLIGYGPVSSLPEPMRERPYYEHNVAVTLVRATSEEMAAAARAMAAKLAKARGPVSVVVPLRGFSQVGEAGAPLHDRRADAAFVDTLRAAIPANVDYHEVDSTINASEFSDVVIDRYLHGAALHITQGSARAGSR